MCTYPKSALVHILYKCQKALLVLSKTLTFLQGFVGALYILINGFLTIKWHDMQNCAIYIGLEQPVIFLILSSCKLDFKNCVVDRQLFSQASLQQQGVANCLRGLLSSPRVQALKSAVHHLFPFMSALSWEATAREISKGRTRGGQDSRDRSRPSTRPEGEIPKTLSSSSTHTVWQSNNS